MNGTFLLSYVIALLSIYSFSLEYHLPLFE
jgi:hypothetical protein